MKAPDAAPAATCSWPAALAVMLAGAPFSARLTPAGVTAAPLRVSLPSRLMAVVVPGCSGVANRSSAAASWLAATLTVTVAVSQTVAFGAGRHSW
uniref:hypothetical protein n=1 Tax=Stenotrophomonas cyclobalanopsidis TaxID=2771362 RepID=UPI003F5ACBEC